jgi:predicted nucleic acid-binding Zn finger protein
MALAFAVSNSLFRGEPVEPTAHEVDLLLANALRLYTVKALQKALSIVDAGGVTCIVGQGTRRELLQVKGGKPGEVYTVHPGHFCSCTAFFYDVVSKQNQLVCKHMLAAQFARKLKRTRTLIISDVELCDLLLTS